jgi:hypothetical protein
MALTRLDRARLEEWEVVVVRAEAADVERREVDARAAVNDPLSHQATRTAAAADASCASSTNQLKRRKTRKQSHQ